VLGLQASSIIPGFSFFSLLPLFFVSVEMTEVWGIDERTLCLPEATNGAGLHWDKKHGWNHLQNPNKSAGPAVPHLMILKGKCEIVEMLMGLGAPSKATRFSQGLWSWGGWCPETAEGCSLESGGLGSQRPHEHMCLWEHPRLEG
jgi:hypothetical protein